MLPCSATFLLTQGRTKLYQVEFHTPMPLLFSGTTTLLRWQGWPVCHPEAPAVVRALSLCSAQLHMHVSPVVCAQTRPIETLFMTDDDVQHVKASAKMPRSCLQGLKAVVHVLLTLC